MADISHYEKCRKTMRTLQRNRKVRFLLTAFCIAVNSMTYFIRMYMMGAYAMDGANTFLSFLFLLASLVGGGFILYVAASATSEPEKPKLLGILLGLLAVALLTKIVLNVFFFLVLIWATQFAECKKAKWLTEQEGYPYFNERFEEQKQRHEYVPTYASDGSFQPKYTGTIEPLPEEAEDAAPVRTPVEMPGIPDIPEQ